MRKILILILVTALIIPYSFAYADLNSRVQDMFNRLGFQGSSTSAGIYDTQSRGYVTGGGISVRTPYDIIQPFSVSPPSIRAGCSGIDVFLGAFSYINLDQLIEKLRIIGTSALSYGFMMAIETLCPQCYNVMKWLEDVSRMANSMAMDTCRAGEMIARGVFGLGGAIKTGQWGRCAGIGNATGGFSDFLEAWRGCAEDLTSGATAATGEDKERALPQGNLVWKGLKKLNLPDEVREQVMSTLGTIIVGTQNDINKVAYKAPILMASDLVNGGQVKVYRCDNLQDCLNPAEVTTNLTGLKDQVKQKLNQAFDNILSKTTPSTSTQQFIEAMPAPVWKFLNVASSYPAPLGRSYIEQQSEALAVLAASYWFDMGLRYTLQSLYQVGLEGKESQELINTFYNGTQEFYKQVYQELEKASAKLKNFDSVLATLDFLEKRTTEGLESKGILAQYNFAKDVRVETK